MSRDEIEALLKARGLRVPEAEMAAFVALMGDIRAAGPVAGKGLKPADELACVLALRPAA